MSKQPERRVLSMDVTELRVSRDEDGDEARIEGLAAVFDSESEDLGGFREVIKPGAFSGALERSDVRVLFNHDPDHVLGRTRSETARVWEDEDGLRFEASLPDTQLARDLVTHIERGDVDGNSFSFVVAEDGDEMEGRSEDAPLRTIHEVEEVFDVGPVTFPAYPATQVSTRAMEEAKELTGGDTLRRFTADVGTVTAGEVEAEGGSEYIRLYDANEISAPAGFILRSGNIENEDEGRDPEIERKRLELERAKAGA